jgi:hypothetical protein
VYTLHWPSLFVGGPTSYTETLMCLLIFHPGEIQHPIRSPVRLRFPAPPTEHAIQPDFVRDVMTPSLQSIINYDGVDV